jgi:hypothetical protein
MKQKTGKKTKKRKEKKYTENGKKKEKGRNGPGPIADQGCAATRVYTDLVGV